MKIAKKCCGIEFYCFVRTRTRPFARHITHRIQCQQVQSLGEANEIGAFFRSSVFLCSCLQEYSYNYENKSDRRESQFSTQQLMIVAVCICLQPIVFVFAPGLLQPIK